MKKRKNHGKTWTEEESQLLLDLIGTTPIEKVMAILGRSLVSIRSKLTRLEVYHLKENGGWLSANQLAIAMNVSFSRLMRLHAHQGLPFETRPITNVTSKEGKYKTYLISGDIFWKWANTHRDLVDFSKIDCEMLIPIPDWFHEEYRKDMNTKPSFARIPWTEQEDKLLLDCFYTKAMTQKMIAEKMGRTERAVSARLKRLRERSLLR